MFQSAMIVGLGGALGAMLRWWIGVALGFVFPGMSLGTLTVNLVAGYIIGVAVVIFAEYPELPHQWRLFIIAGFLGGLSTFSAFSAEVAVLLKEQRMMLAGLEIGLHVIGSVFMTLLGMGTVSLLRAQQIL